MTMKDVLDRYKELYPGDDERIETLAQEAAEEAHEMGIEKESELILYVSSYLANEL